MIIVENIENTYTKYDELIKKVGKETIDSRINQFVSEMTEFIKANSLEEYTRIDEFAVGHAVMDYFSDIQRLKDYQEIEHANEFKIKAYETFWLLQRKPIQIVKELKNDVWLYVNEKFLLNRLASFMLRENINVTLIGSREKAFKSYLDTLYYSLKFRRCDKQSLELMLLSFEAGKLIGGVTEPRMV